MSGQKRQEPHVMVNPPSLLHTFSCCTFLGYMTSRNLNLAVVFFLFLYVFLFLAIFLEYYLP